MAYCPGEGSVLKLVVLARRRFFSGIFGFGSGSGSLIASRLAVRNMGKLSSVALTESCSALAGDLCDPGDAARSSVRLCSAASLP